MNTALLIYTLVIGSFIVFLFMYLFFRIGDIKKERIRVLTLVTNKSQFLIVNGDGGRWRNIYDDYDKISFRIMFFKFWKSVKSFYEPLVKKYNLE